MPSDYEAITHHNERQLGLDTATRRTQICMYSDSTHFVYEILQNADDYDATEVSFSLTDGELVIEHNGKPFVEENVKAITYFGKSTSKDDLVKTGRFGVGFKSVFAFTASPTVVSGNEHFQIYGLYRVRRHPYSSDLKTARTRITIPFNHETEKPDYVEELMSPVEAYEKIASRLTGLNMNTLLFTQNIKEIRWAIKGRCGHYQREDTPRAHSRSTTITDGQQVNTYFVFHQIPHWGNHEYKAVEVAFAIDENRQIIPIQDFLYVLFPTTQETHLQFVLNGPFRTNPSRETISEDDHFNVHLMKEICALMRQLLPILKAENLLTTQFLPVLPIASDGFRAFYAPLYEAIVETFRTQALLPTDDNSYACAANMFQGPARIREVIQKQELRFLTNDEESCWAKGVQQKQNPRTDQFLRGLGIDQWGWEELQAVLYANYGGAITSSEKNQASHEWLTQRGDAWMQKLYILLAEGLRKEVCEGAKMRSCRIVRVREKGAETHVAGYNAYFPKGASFNELPQVKPNILIGKTEQTTKQLKDSLIDLGVSTIGDEERIDIVLSSFYADESVSVTDQQHLQHISNFIKWWKREKFIGKFQSCAILRIDGKAGFYTPSACYIEAPLKATGLNKLYAADNCTISRRQRLWSGYSKLAKSGFCEFAIACGVQSEIAIERQKCYKHPNSATLRQDYNLPGVRYIRRSATDIDFTICDLPALLRMDSIDVNRLVWLTVAKANPEVLEASFRPNKGRDMRFDKSSLVLELSRKAWIPNRDGVFQRPAQVTKETLHPTFKYDNRNGWLDAIGFGSAANTVEAEFVARREAAETIGLAPELAEELRSLSAEQQKELLDRIKASKRRESDFPQDEGSNSDLRAKRAEEQARRARSVERDVRSRTVRTSSNRPEVREYLSQKYTRDGRLFCQMSQEEMPFLLPSNEPYFEAVKILPLGEEHVANHLCLSPTCAAEFQHALQTGEDALRARILNVDPEADYALECEVEVPLTAHQKIRFVRSHLKDLQAALRIKGPTLAF